MPKPDIDTLNVVQEVLRGVLTSLATSQSFDTAKFATVMQAFSQAPNLEPMSRTMLEDLAQGMDMLARLKTRPS